MIDAGTVKLLIAAGLILVTGGVSVVAGVGASVRSAEPLPEPQPDPLPAPGRGDAEAVRLRILTGEPGPPEARRPVVRRALRLVLGIGLLAAGGAIGLLALVRGIIEMFRRATR